MKKTNNKELVYAQMTIEGKLGLPTRSALHFALLRSATPGFHGSRRRYTPHHERQSGKIYNVCKLTAHPELLFRSKGTTNGKVINAQIHINAVLMGGGGRRIKLYLTP